MDETRLAKQLRRLFTKLRKNDSVAALKLSLDGVKEWIRALEIKRAPAGSPEPETPVMVQLVHAVPRPDRAGSETLDSKKEPS